MVIASTRCCAIFEIDKLGGYHSAEEAMRAFCTQAIPGLCKFGQGGIGAADELASFYFFTSAVSHDGSRAAGIFAKGEHLYAKEFMKLIQREGLGDVWESPIRVNKAFHVGNSNQVYVWMPDQAKLKAWWKAHQEPQPGVLDRPLKV